MKNRSMIRPGDEPIPGYRVEELLGRGQYGEVWRATSPGRSTVALKFLDMTGRHGWKEFRSVQRVKQIRHAHLMPIVALWLLDQDGEILNDDAVDNFVGADVSSAETISPETAAAEKPPAQMIIANLLGDKSLRDRFHECENEGLDGIPRDELLLYMQEAAKGIDHLNSVQHDLDGGQVGVQHCDIKPDNIMLMGGSIVICDFGVAKVFGEGDASLRATTLSGSPAYMPPEAFQAQPSHSSDQYSLAVTYYELRTGALPVQEQNFMAAYEAHRTGQLDFSRVGSAEQEVLRRATDPEPQRRFASAGEFVEALQGVTAETAPPRRSAAPWVALALLTIAAAGGAAFYWRPTSTAERIDVELRFDAPRAEVVVDGESLEADEDGVVAVQVDPQAPLQVKIKRGAGRQEKQWTISRGELATQRKFELVAPVDLPFFLDAAARLLAAGSVDEAAREFAVAIKAAPDQHARLPDPRSLSTAAMMRGDCLRVDPAGSWLVSGGIDGVIRRWKIGADGVNGAEEVVHRHEDARVVSVAVSAAAVASASDFGDVRITRDEQSVALVEGDAADVALAIDGAGRRLTAGISSELTTRLVAWDLDAAEIGATQQEIGEQPGEFPQLVRCAGASVAVATKDDVAIVRQWRLDDKDHVELGRQQNDVLTLVATRDGKHIAYAGVANSQSQLDEASLVNVGSSARFPLAERQADSVLACAVDDSGQLLATAERIGAADARGAVRLWRPDLASGRAILDGVLQFDGELGAVHALLITQGGRWVAAGHAGGAVTLWRLGEGGGGSPVASFGRGSRITALLETPDGRWIVSGDRDGQILILDLLRIDMIEQACRRAGVTPANDRDRVTLRDRPVRPGLRCPWGNAETACPLLGRPIARRV